MKNGKSFSIKAKVAVFMTLLLSSVLATTFIISYSAAKKQIISINEEMARLSEQLKGMMASFKV